MSAPNRRPMMMNPTPTSSIFEFRRYSSRTRGFALVVVLAILAMLGMFLLAAQNGVQTTMTVVKRSQQRLDRAEGAARMLAEAMQNLKSGKTEAPGPVEANGTKLAAALRPLQAGDPVYTAVPGIDFRSGDAVLEITWTAKDKTDTEQYLLNGASRRSGALKIR